MCSLVCFGIGTKYLCLGIKAGGSCVCVLCVLCFLAQQNVRADPNKKKHPDSLTFSRTAHRLARTPEAQVTYVKAEINWILRLFACRKPPLFTRTGTCKTMAEVLLVTEL